MPLFLNWLVYYSTCRKRILLISFRLKLCLLLSKFVCAGGHLGRDKTVEKICSHFYWGKGMYEEIRGYVRTCDICQQVNDKFEKTSSELHPIPVTPEVWKQVCSIYMLCL